MRKAKYIVGELPSGMGTTLGAVIFPNYIDHARVAILFAPNGIESAGFFTVHDGVVYPEGESTGLKLSSRPTDDRIIARAIGLPLPSSA